MIGAIDTVLTIRDLKRDNRHHLGVLSAIYLCDPDDVTLRGPLTRERRDLLMLFRAILSVSPEQWDAILARKLRGDLS